MIMLGQVAAAKASWQNAPANDRDRLVAEAILMARNGDQRGALRNATALEQLIGDNASYSIAAVYAQLGDANKAFAALGRALTPLTTVSLVC